MTRERFDVFPARRSTTFSVSSERVIDVLTRMLLIYSRLAGSQGGHAAVSKGTLNRPTPRSRPLEPLEPHGVVRLVPLEDLPDRRLLFARHHLLLDAVEADAHSISIVLERPREHRLQLVPYPPGVGDLHGAPGVIGAREEPHEERAEDVVRLLERLHEPEGERDERRSLVRGEPRGHPLHAVRD